jgi:hypothetical protein
MAAMLHSEVGKTKMVYYCVKKYWIFVAVTFFETQITAFIKRKYDFNCIALSMFFFWGGALGGAVG